MERGEGGRGCWLRVDGSVIAPHREGWPFIYWRANEVDTCAMFMRKEKTHDKGAQQHSTHCFNFV